MKFIRLWVAALLFTSAAASHAQGADATPPPSAEAVQVALTLFDGQDLEGQMLAAALQMTDASLGAEKQAMRARGVELPKELEEKLRQLVFAETKAMVEEMSSTFRLEAAAVYARHFTVEELRQLKRLQSNPIMRKAEKLMPQMMVEIGKAGLKLSAERRPEIERKALDLVKEWMQDQELVSPASKS